MHICKSTLHGYKHLDSQIRQEHIRLEAGEVQNGCIDSGLAKKSYTRVPQELYNTSP